MVFAARVSWRKIAQKKRVSSVVARDGRREHPRCGTGHSPTCQRVTVVQLSQLGQAAAAAAAGAEGAHLETGQFNTRD